MFFSDIFGSSFIQLHENFGYIAFSIGLFFATHLISFIFSLGAVESSGDVMFQPYKRIIPLHLTIVFGGFIIAFFEAGTAYIIILVFFLCVKTALDTVLEFNLLSKTKI